MKKTIKTMETTAKIESYEINVSFKQEGYGRQGLYVNGHYLMSVFPNFEEYFGVIREDDAFIRTNDNDQFIDEDGNVVKSPEYMDCQGNTTNIYQSKEQFMIDNYHDDITRLLDSHEDEEE